MRCLPIASQTAHSALTEKIGTSRLEEQLQTETKRSHAHPKEVSYLRVCGTLPPNLVNANVGVGQPQKNSV